MRSRGSMALAMAIFGTISLFVKHIPLSSGEVVLCRALLAIGVISLFLLVRKHPIPFAQIKGELPLLLLSGVAVGVNWLLLFQAYRYTSVSIATLSYYFAPVLVTIACPILFREKLTRQQVLWLLTPWAIFTAIPVRPAQNIPSFWILRSPRIIPPERPL